jgi:hypothetical protein
MEKSKDKKKKTIHFRKSCLSRVLRTCGRDLILPHEPWRASHSSPRPAQQSHMTDSCGP